MLRRHVGKYLSAYSHGELSSDQASSIAQHLLGCDRCRKELDEIEWGISLARHLPKLPAPSGLSNAMQNLFQSGSPTPRVSRPLSFPQARWLAIPAAVAMLGAVLGSVLWYQRMRDNPISIASTGRSATKLEVLALDLHMQQRRGLQQLDFSTEDPQALRVWAAQQTGLKLDLADQPAGGDPQYQVDGARIWPTSRGQIVSVFFTVDQIPVTLIAANVRTVAKGEVPSKGIFQKKIFYRFDSASNTSLLSWTRDDQSYVLASDLPNLGRAACFVCHTSPHRRELIGNAKLER